MFLCIYRRGKILIETWTCGITNVAISMFTDNAPTTNIFKLCSHSQLFSNLWRMYINAFLVKNLTFWYIISMYYETKTKKWQPGGFAIKRGLAVRCATFDVRFITLPFILEALSTNQNAVFLLRSVNESM